MISFLCLACHNYINVVHISFKKRCIMCFSWFTELYYSSFIICLCTHSIIFAVLYYLLFCWITLWTVLFVFACKSFSILHILFLFFLMLFWFLVYFKNLFAACVVNSIIAVCISQLFLIRFNIFNCSVCLSFITLLLDFTISFPIDILTIF